MLEGKEAQFDCEVFPEHAEVKWCRNGEEISAIAKYQTLKSGKSRCLTLKDCQEEDAGLLETRLGNNHITSRLSVQGLCNTYRTCILLSI